MEAIAAGLRWALPLIFGAVAGCSTVQTSAGGEQTVRFAGKDVELSGVLFTPAAPVRTGARHPAIVMLHGCSGLFDARGRLSTGNRDRAERLVREGFVALLVDSFGPRGLGSVCDMKERPADPWTVRAGDAYAALDYLVARKEVDPRQVFVLGWSHGGSTVMGVVSPEAAGRRDGGPRFKAAIALYPGCQRPLRTRGYRTTMPMLILHGENDDWTPAAPCVELARRSVNMAFPVRTVVYPGAHHGFDAPNTPVRQLPKVFNPGSPTGRGAHVGTHEPSRLMAIEETKRFLEAQRTRPAPDEEKLGRGSGYPVGTARNWYYMGLLIVKDGVVQVERYQYDRKPSDRFTSQSMAKSITALAVGFALGEGHIASLDDRADRYAPRLGGTVLGETTVRNLLRMASGARYEQTYDGSGDPPRFNAAIARDGIEGAARIVTDRDTEQGARFYYAGPHTAVLAAVVRGAVGTSLSEYLTPRLWQAIGAEQTA